MYLNNTVFLHIIDALTAGRKWDFFFFFGTTKRSMVNGLGKRGEVENEATLELHIHSIVVACHERVIYYLLAVE